MVTRNPAWDAGSQPWGHDPGGDPDTLPSAGNRPTRAVCRPSHGTRPAGRTRQGWRGKDRTLPRLRAGCRRESPSARYPDLFAEIARLAPVTVPLRAVFPPKTPVCFASMFTGAPPADHGIRKYERPVLQCDTLFDALVRAGRRVAIVAVTDSSIDRIFRRQNLDYFSGDYDPDVTARAIALIEADEHEFILAYHQEYDDLLHENDPVLGPGHPGVPTPCRRVRELVGAADQYWLGHDRAMVFAPDHGAHLDPETMTGTHGEDIPQDMELMHFYSFSGSGQTTRAHPEDSGDGRPPDRGDGKV